MEKIYNKSYEDLRVWQKAIELTTRLYVIVKHFPKDEVYGLTSQLKRSCVSISANISGGRGRNTIGEFLQFLGYASGSRAEMHTLLIIAKNVGVSSAEDFSDLLKDLAEIGKMLSGLKKSLAAKPSYEQLATGN
ncbi:MAG: four helix bundle protein [Pseudomonadota bacterium]|nr:four helix bundle protein [Pseudomonadota bacterium]MDE3037722.1 four helix bundle protein [Pseudomonadota bacterium]